MRNVDSSLTYYELNKDRCLANGRAYRKTEAGRYTQFAGTLRKYGMTPPTTTE